MGEHCWVEQGGEKYACDVRIHLNSEIVGIEAKDKKSGITEKDLEKFDRDRTGKHYIGGVFWSKSRVIPSTADTGEGDGYCEMKNLCLYIRGYDLERFAEFIFVY